MPQEVLGSNYSFLLLKKSREVDRLNEKLVVQEALTPHDTDDLFELFSESLKIGRAIRVVGNETIHKLHLLLKELETYEATENSNNTTKNVTAELKELNEIRSKDKRHNAAVLIQTFFRAKKVFYDERVNRIARFLETVQLHNEIATQRNVCYAMSSVQKADSNRAGAR